MLVPLVLELIPVLRRLRSHQNYRKKPPSARASSSEQSLLMDFGTSGPSSGSSRPLHVSQSAPASLLKKTRAEMLQEEYAKKQQKQNKVWDKIDQRWVVVDEGKNNLAANASVRPGVASSLPPKTKIKGVKLDASNAVGKSAGVQKAVYARVKEMEDNQNKAKAELREREDKKKNDEAAEDEVRKRLEPKCKAWSEEHGKKKQLRALLASLHMILWAEANWKQVNLGDLLDDKKMRRCYLRATLKVHPDKTKDLDAEKRFIAKRVFDALSQAMTAFEDGNRG
mmetsp:Transcript_17490/g.25708  ORF Transcript_17490/g.25708 Transcript_17490/m.25708 type:complete len:282 (-) Transcript_17490:221-1066(-)